MAVKAAGIGPTALRTYTWPDYDASVLTSSVAVAPYTIGDLLYASSTTALSKLADVATGSVLVSGGVGIAPAWSASPTISGTVTGGNFISTTGGQGYAAATTGFYYWTSRAAFSSPADSQINLTNNAASIGVGFDVASDAVLKVRTRAQSAYAQVDALGYSTGGVAGVTTFGPAGVTSITVKGGIITAIS